MYLTEATAAIAWYLVYRGLGGFSSGLLKLFPVRFSWVLRTNTPTVRSVELGGEKLLEPRRQPALTTIDWIPGVYCPFYDHERKDLFEEANKVHPKFSTFKDN
ncbi:hypothetical protein Bbelb_192220 [Branchiostoma belcheri]|nr:hypothetical protein Bbelb_192220 [Branchiostoma belcheri]